MIPFEIEKLTVEHVELKSITTALGGSMSILNKAATVAKGKEVFTKVDVPIAIARNFIKLHEVGKYLKPVITAVVKYDGHVVALDRHPLGGLGSEETEDLNGNIKIWESTSEKNINKFIVNTTRMGKWYIDGTYLYRFTQDDNTPLTADGKFQIKAVDAIKLMTLYTNDISLQSRSCLSFTTNSGVNAISPPIWKELSKVGTRQLERLAVDDAERDDQSSIDFQFDRIDENMIVNLSFALNAGKILSDVFGYQIIEPLQLDELMIHLQTVNLPKVSKHIKRTYDIGIPFTHVLVWLLGLINRTDTLEAYISVRAVMKYLTTKGVYRKTALTANAIFQADKTGDDVPLIQRDEALENTKDKYNPFIFTRNMKNLQQNAA